MKPEKFFMGYSVDRAAISEAQAVLVLLFIVLLLAIVVKVTVGDSLVAASERIAKFRVWGAENEVSGPAGEKSTITITTPPDGDIRYLGEILPISGRIAPGQGRKIMLVYYRVNDGDWRKAVITADRWEGIARTYPVGNYKVEAVAYDDLGNETKPAISHFTVLFRYYNDAVYVSDNIPTTMIAGDRYPCQITYENTGNLAWTEADGYELAYHAGSFNFNPIPAPAAGVSPGERYSFTTTLNAPEKPGLYTIVHRMRGGGYGWFGGIYYKRIQVNQFTVDAKVVSIDIPAEMAPGETYQAKITMRNTGTSTWYADGAGHVDLAAVDAANGVVHKFAGWTSMAMSPGRTVKPGEEYTFEFPIRAPYPAEYDLKFRMIAGDKDWFGEEAGKTVKVMRQGSGSGTGGGNENNEPYEAYLASGNFKLIDIWGHEKSNCMVVWRYDGPLVRHNERSSYIKKDGHPDWDIGGPNGRYSIYSDQYTGGGSFDMNYGGDKGTITFYER